MLQLVVQKYILTVLFLIAAIFDSHDCKTLKKQNYVQDKNTVFISVGQILLAEQLLAFQQVLQGNNKNAQIFRSESPGYTVTHRGVIFHRLLSVWKLLCMSLRDSPLFQSLVIFACWLGWSDLLLVGQGGVNCCLLARVE